MYMNRQPENTLRQIVSKYLMIGFMVGSSAHLVLCSYQDCKNQQAAAQASTALGDRYALDYFKPWVVENTCLIELAEPSLWNDGMLRKVSAAYTDPRIDMLTKSIQKMNEQD